MVQGRVNKMGKKAMKLPRHKMVPCVEWLEWVRYFGFSLLVSDMVYRITVRYLAHMVCLEDMLRRKCYKKVS